tara:strand:- start:227 stop:730 length:504 start_codon:yes stop_codon:yes gene_type:complete
MNVISPTGNNTIKVIPRAEYSYITVLLTNVSSNEKETVLLVDQTYTDLNKGIPELKKRVFADRDFLEAIGCLNSFVADFNLTPIFTDNSMSFILESSVKTLLKIQEGQFIQMNVYGTGNSSQFADNLMYRGRLFTTVQSIDQVKNQTYSVNKDAYKENESQNDYIII